MGQTKRTTKLKLRLDKRKQGGANTSKKECLTATAQILNMARTFYVGFLLAYPEKLKEKVTYFSEKYQETREKAIGADDLLTWAESQTVATAQHPKPLANFNFTELFPNMPVVYRRCVIKDAIGKVRSYLSNLSNFIASGKNGKPSIPTANNHPTLYKGSLELHLEQLDYQKSFLRIKVYDDQKWIWANYPVHSSRWLLGRMKEDGWEMCSPKLVLKPRAAELHISQTKTIKASTVTQRKQNPDLVTVAVDLNVKNLAVITVCQHSKIIKTLFFKDHGLDAHRYGHLKKIAKKQWLSGKPVNGERSNRLLWEHVKRTNQNFAHQAARTIASTCSDYPGCVLIFENLRKIKRKADSYSRKLNRKLSNQIRGLILDFAKYKAFALGIVTVECNAHGTSQFCCRCGLKGERFSLQKHCKLRHKGGKLFCCPSCSYQANADFNASANLHHSFYRRFHWQPRTVRGQPPPCLATSQMR